MDRRLRLREDADIRRVRSRGRSVAEGPLLGRVLANGLVPPRNRYTVVAGKKQGNAVARNRVKRLVREALRHLHPALAPGFDLAIYVRGKAEEIPSAAAARTRVERIVRRAGLLTETGRRGDEETREDGGRGGLIRQPSGHAGEAGQAGEAQ
jgi:ribonuclease P protein component